MSDAEVLSDVQSSLQAGQEQPVRLQRRVLWGAPRPPRQSRSSRRTTATHNDKDHTHTQHRHLKP